MQPTYENQDNALAITEPVTTLVTMDELLAEKAQIEGDMASATANYTDLQSVRQTRLDTVNEKILKAEQLGVVSIENTADEQVEEIEDDSNT